jgi:large subunit ribosomal protein L10e
MGLRPAKCYGWDSPAYTRVSNNPGDSFITGIPGSKINRFEMGNPKGVFDTEITIVTDQDIQIRSNALESARVAANKILEDNLGVSNYRIKVRTYPHHVIRENVMATGAGADRVQMGMRQSFGKPMGTAARMKAGTKIMSVYINKNDTSMSFAKKAMKSAGVKLPCDSHVEIAQVAKKVKKPETKAKKN